MSLLEAAHDRRVRLLVVVTTEESFQTERIRDQCLKNFARVVRRGDVIGIPESPTACCARVIAVWRYLTAEAEHLIACSIRLNAGRRSFFTSSKKVP